MERVPFLPPSRISMVLVSEDISKSQSFGMVVVAGRKEEGMQRN